MRTADRRSVLPEFRTRFHIKTRKGVMKLGRVGYRLVPTTRGEVHVSPGSYDTKRSFITRGRRQGQTSEGNGERQFPNWGGLEARSLDLEYSLLAMLSVWEA